MKSGNHGKDGRPSSGTSDGAGGAAEQDFFRDFDDIKAEACSPQGDAPAAVRAAGKGKKKKMSRGTRVLLTIACVLVGLALILGVVLLVMTMLGRSALSSSAEGLNLNYNRGDAEVESLDASTIRYNGQLYRYNTDIVTILFMGVDEHEKQVVEGQYGNAHQTDANVLAVINMRSNTLTLISVSRDSMCRIDILDEYGNHTGTATAQLALAYSYGDGGEASCKLTSAAVSRLFYDLPVSAHASIYMNGISKLTDAVGGVTVTPATSFGPFAEGRPVTLKGSLTEEYLRYRSDSLEGNNQRMERQKQVITALARVMLDRIKENPIFALSLYNEIVENVTTDIDASMIVYLAQQVAGMDFSGNVVNVKGESVLGAENHAEYNVDEDALLALIVDVFYEPADG